MSVSVEKIEGVELVKVSLNEGLARIKLKPENRVSIVQLSETVINNGFTPREARVEAIGQVIEKEGVLYFQVGALDQAFRLSVSKDAKITRRSLEQQAGKVLRVEGVIPPADSGQASSLEIVAFRQVSR